MSIFSIDKDVIVDYLISRNMRWSLAVLVISAAFFVSPIIPQSLFWIKVAVVLLFGFVIPGFLAVKILYPKSDEISVEEMFALSIAFSIGFMLAVMLLLNNLKAISQYSLTVVMLPLFFLLFVLALKRSFKAEEAKEKKVYEGFYWPLGILLVISFYIYSHNQFEFHFLRPSIDPLMWLSRSITALDTGGLSIKEYPFMKGYPPGFPFIITFITIFTNASPYEVMRFISVFSFLDVIPVYLLAFRILNSKGAALVSAAMWMTTREMYFHLMGATPRMMVHFMLPLFLLYFLITLQNSTPKNRFIASSMLAIMVLIYHFELSILALFVILLFVVLTIRTHIFGISNRRYVKTVLVVILGTVIIIGAFWYFWHIGDIAGFYDKKFSSGKLDYIEEKVAPKLKLPDYVRNIGTSSLVLSISGLTLMILRGKIHKRIEYIFLATYFFSIIIMLTIIPLAIAPVTRYFTLIDKSVLNTLWYFFAYLSLPLAIFSGYAIGNIIRKFRVDLDHSKVISIFVVFIVLLFNFPAYNYAMPDKAKEIAKSAVSNKDYSVLLPWRFNFNKKLQNYPIYQALTWINQTTSNNSKLLVLTPCAIPGIKSLVGQRSTIFLNLKKIDTVDFAQRYNDFYIISRKCTVLPLMLNKTENIFGNKPQFKEVFRNQYVLIYKGGSLASNQDPMGR